MIYLVLIIGLVLIFSSCYSNKKSDEKDMKVKFKEYDDEKIKNFKVKTMGGLFDSYLTEQDDYKYVDAK